MFSGTKQEMGEEKYRNTCRINVLKNEIDKIYLMDLSPELKESKINELESLITLLMEEKWYLACLIRDLDPYEEFPKKI